MEKRGGTIRDFIAGIGLLGRGFAMYGTDTGLIALGLVPALIASVLLLAVLVVLIVFIGDLSSAVTWFAHGWPTDAREAVQVIAGISLIGIFGLLAIVTFTSLTLAIGDPFYEKISERVEQRLDARDGSASLPPRVDLPWWTEFGRGIGESLRTLLVSAAIGIPLFLAGFIPAVGQTVVPVIGALFGGWFLAIELVGIPFMRRGLRLRDRRAALRRHRALAVGFGAAVFACFLIPLGAILVTPAAVAGGTVLARRVLADPGR
ncbi:MAG TPA: EI24 domain-containing protein [Micromonosporaceae bacterium]|jgi:CysZ protein